ncbi:alpha/beta-hydrolase [Laetiporus sulphureus 93-53]|uniref:Alpha/beta-hydrolase n=1 Tax=Laetiporus sulphureus 93-53 TaxID=1314785 RepID=A0A165CC30_9APHY|nr:alpha/beta-hydrolase [Laetiporus sulphureus 93-53]KZT02542.1 alpha/beta-hydrolase [Laetiporus sulphureus 93-53]
MSTPIKQTIAVGGITVHVYSQPNATNAAVPVAVLFFLHGRTGSAQECEWVAQSTLKWTEEQRKSTGKQAQDLLIVTLDQRNHGARIIDVQANSGWREQAPAKNDRHGLDMYAIYTGTSKDVSFLIDFLPSYLYPSGERAVAQWLVGGISLGGHATWYTLRNEPRVKTGIPIIGCPDYIKLMAERAEKNGVPFVPPYIPKSLLDFIQTHDAAAAPYTSTDSSNPFLGKKVLVLSGADDKLVPWTASQDFVEGLNVGESGVKQVVVAPGVGHECTPDMVKIMSNFIWDQVLVL